MSEQTPDVPDDRPNLPAPGTSSEIVHRTPTPMPIGEFEGELVRVMRGKLPAIELDMAEGYARNTHLKLEIEVRVSSVNHPEIKVGKELMLGRVHTLVYEDIKLIGAYTAAQLDAGTGGDLSEIDPDDDEPDNPDETLDERPEQKESDEQRHDPGF